MTNDQCPTCHDTKENHNLTLGLCPEMGCMCRNCYWCGHQFQIKNVGIELDHDEALALDQMVEADREFQTHQI